MWWRHHGNVPVGVVDVGSNTVRLEVARGMRTLHSEKVMMRLGESIERTGAIPPDKLDEVSLLVESYCAEALRHGAMQLEVLVTSPGRQAANGKELLERLASVARGPVRLLTSEDEGRLGFAGAVERARLHGQPAVAVCDVGGGSAQIAIGSKRTGASWVRSIDIGSMRLTARLLDDDPPGKGAMRAARAQVDGLLENLDPPKVAVALAVGGSARALRALTGSTLGEEELREACAILATTPREEIVRTYGVDPARVRTLAAGAVILSSIGALLGTPLRVGRGGVREGAVLELESRIRAAA
jgi:exopolyphosphatase/guanosine-5'-triphosphate,3'-diphosphate pyrophosphatase